MELEGHRVLLVHELGEAATRSIEAHAVVVHGSTHRREAKRHGEALVVNPGEACGWLTGIPTAAIVDLDTRHVEFVELTGPEWRV